MCFTVNVDCSAQSHHHFPLSGGDDGSAVVVVVTAAKLAVDRWQLIEGPTFLSGALSQWRRASCFSAASADDADANTCFKKLPKWHSVASGETDFEKTELLKGSVLTAIVPRLPSSQALFWKPHRTWAEQTSSSQPRDSKSAPLRAR